MISVYNSEMSLVMYYEAHTHLSIWALICIHFMTDSNSIESIWWEKHCHKAKIVEAFIGRCHGLVGFTSFILYIKAKRGGEHTGYNSIEGAELHVKNETQYDTM